MKRLGAVAACCIAVAFGSWAAVAGASPGSGESAGKQCAAIKKDMGIQDFKLFYGDASGNHAMTNCKAQHS